MITGPSTELRAGMIRAKKIIGTGPATYKRISACPITVEGKLTTASKTMSKEDVRDPGEAYNHFQDNGSR